MKAQDSLSVVVMGVSAVDAEIKARYIPVSQLATTPLQQSAVAIIFLMTFLAFTVWGIRVYSRVLTKQFGVGTRLTFPTISPPSDMVIPNGIFD